MGLTTTSRRWLGPVWPLAQQSAAAVVAWLIAVRVAGHADPFFAPVAAVVGLNAVRGRRGSNAVRLVAGVVIGVLVGELAVGLAGGGVVALAVATFVAMLIARAVDNARIVVAQAAVSAILITVLGRPEHGWDRLIDALIGAGVALTFSQLLFSPEPIRLLRNAEAAVLSRLADGLRVTGDAVERGDRKLAESATTTLRSLRDDLSTLSTMRAASDRVIRHSVLWRRRAGLVLAERERADHLDLLAVSCLMLTRTAAAVDGPSRRPLAATVTRLAATLADLSADPGDRAIRQSAADRAADLAAWLAEHGRPAPAGSPLGAAYGSIRMVAADVMVFAGIDPEPAFREPSAG